MGRYLRLLTLIPLLPIVFVASVGWALWARCRRSKDCGTGVPPVMDVADTDDFDPLDAKCYPKGMIVEVKEGQVVRLRSMNDAETHSGMEAQFWRPMGVAIPLGKRRGP